MTYDRLFCIARCCVGIFFVLSGIGKLLDSTLAARAASYAIADVAKLLPEHGRLVMVGVSVVEILLGALLLLGRLVLPTLLGMAAMLMVFTVSLGVLAFKGDDVPTCGCSGAFDFGMTLETALARNAVLYAVLLWMMFTAQYRCSTSTHTWRKAESG
jgi:uncharacterized membrane protein YphA (DoxX/SURF4 family)